MTYNKHMAKYLVKDSTHNPVKVGDEIKLESLNKVGGGKKTSSSKKSNSPKNPPYVTWDIFNSFVKETRNNFTDTKQIIKELKGQMVTQKQFDEIKSQMVTQIDEIKSQMVTQKQFDEIKSQMVTQKQFDELKQLIGDLANKVDSLPK